MRETEAEALVRDTFRSREHLVHAGHESLVEAVRRRTAHRRGRAVVAAGLTALAVLLGLSGTAVVMAVRDDSVQSGPIEPAESVPADGWRWESSRGAQILVPADWARNDYGCNMTAQPSVVRGNSAGRMCLTREPPAKEVAIIAGWPSESPVEAPPEPDLPERGVTIDGTAAQRAEGMLPDGRYTGWVTVPSRQVRVVVRTLAAATMQRILDSLQLVNVDHVGCPTRRPSGVAPGPPSESFVPADPTAVSICNYYARGELLQSSTRLVGAEARALATTLNQAPPGPNPPASECLQFEPPVPEAFLIMGSQVLSVTYSGCTGRGVDNGVRQVHVTQTLIHQVMRPLGGGYAFNGDIPG